MHLKNPSSLGNFDLLKKRTEKQLVSITDRAKADDYYEDVTNKVNLEDLYEVHSTCYFDDEMEYNPVLFKIKQKQIKEVYDQCDYLLQIWDYDGDKYYEKPLQQPPRLWSIQDKIFVYQPSEKDLNSEFVLVYNVESKHTCKIKNFTNESTKFIVYDKKQEILVSASNEEIKIIQLNKSHFKSEALLDANDLKVITIKPELGILALFISTEKTNILFETTDHQIDPNHLLIENLEGEGETDFKFIQIAEICPRDTNNKFVYDPIVKLDYLVEYGSNYVTAIRKSGKFDIYRNYQRTDSPEDKYAVNVQADLNSFYITLENKDVFCLSTAEQGNFTFAQAVKEVPKNVTPIINKVSHMVNLFNGFQIRYEESCLLLISHGKFISVYNLEEKIWIRHTKYEDDILRLFRYKNGGETMSCIILKNGEIYQNILQETRNHVPSEDSFLTIAGELLDAAEDPSRAPESLYIFTKWQNGDEEEEEDDDDQSKESKNTFKVQILYKNTLFDVNSLPVITTQNYNIVTFKEIEDYVLVQKDKTFIYLYKVIGKTADGEVPESLDFELVYEFPEFPEIAETIHSINSNNLEDHIFMCDVDNAYLIDIKKLNIKVFEGEEIICTAQFSPKIMYVLTQGTQVDERCGLGIINLESILKKGVIDRIIIKEFYLGYSRNIEANFSTQRLGYQENLQNIIVSPFFHLNTLKFMGIKEQDQYLTYKIIGNKFIALTKTNQLMTWDRRTGDVIFSVKLPAHQNFSEYEVHDPENIRDQVLIRSTEDISNCNDPDFDFQQYFPDWKIKKNDPKQVTYLVSQAQKEDGIKIKQWKVIEIVSSSEVREIITYQHPLYPAGHSVYFNQDRTQMLEKHKNSQVYLYVLEHNLQLKNSNETSNMPRWHLLRKVENFPQELDIELPVLPFYTPDFTLRLQCDFEAGQFLIVDNLTNQTKIRVPKDYMTFEKGDADSIKNVIRRFMFVDSENFKIVSSDGLEKLVNISTGQIVELAFNKIPRFTEDDVDDLEQGHYYFKKAQIDTVSPDQTLQRLVRRYQETKSYILLDNKPLDNLHDEVFKIDPYDWRFIDMSFNFMTWSLIEQVENGVIELQDIDKDFLKMMLYVILPSGDTVLHRLAYNKTRLEKLLTTCHPEENGVVSIKYFVPVLPNKNKETAFHICARNNEFKSLNLMLNCFKMYEVDHHARFIKELFALFLEKDLPEFPEYISARFIQTQQLKTITKGILNKKSNGVMLSQLWFDKMDFDKNIIDKLGKVEERINCYIWDMPGINHYLDGEFADFFDQLSQTENYNYFALEPIRRLIDHNFPLVKKYSIIKLLLPFFVFIGFYFYYFSVCLENEIYDKSWTPTADIFSVIVVIFATYFFKNEVQELYHEGIFYFGSFWNYVDIGPALGIYALFIIRIMDKFSKEGGVGELDQDTVRAIQAVTTWLMWFKFLYFFRLLKETGYLIRMIMEVIADMRNFILVMLITICAFGHSTLTLVLGYPAAAEGEEDPKFITTFVGSIMYTYEVILGGFDPSKFQETNYGIVYIVFLGCTVFNMIVMLNLLIAIISETFGNVNGNSENAAYQEMASIISENQYLVPAKIQETYSPKNGFLLAVLLEQEKVLDPNTVIFNKLKAFEGHFGAIKSEIGEIKEMLLRQGEKKKKAGVNTQLSLKNQDLAADEEENNEEEED